MEIEIQVEIENLRKVIEERTAKRVAAWDEYKKLNVSALRGIFERSHRVCDTRGMTKTDLIAAIASDEFPTDRLEKRLSKLQAALPSDQAEEELA